MAVEPALTMASESNPSNAREWLGKHHPKQLALLDKFEIELRLGRLGTKKGRNDRRVVATRTVELIRIMIGNTRWKTPAQLFNLLRGLGRELHAAGGFREPAIGNVVRRILAAVRDEAMNLPPPDDDVYDENGTNFNNGEEDKDTFSNDFPSPSSRLNVESGSSNGVGGARRRTLDSLLWSLPQHVKSTSRTPNQKGRSESSFASSSDLLYADDVDALAFPPSFYQPRPDLIQSLMEVIQEILSDLEDLHTNINEQAANHIHAGEIILTYGKSQTVEKFLKEAAKKQRRFTVMVCEGGAQCDGHDLAKALTVDLEREDMKEGSDASSFIEVCMIHDSAVMAVMARVHKVILPAHAVLADGGLLAPSGSNLVVLAAAHNAVPVVCVTGMFKLTPLYPHQGQDTSLNDWFSPGRVLDYADPLLQDNQGYTDMIVAGPVELVHPVHDYIRPELINLYITNVGSFQPSYIYRLLAEYYHNDDWDPFE